MRSPNPDWAAYPKSRLPTCHKHLPVDSPVFRHNRAADPNEFPEIDDLVLPTHPLRRASSPRHRSTARSDTDSVARDLFAVMLRFCLKALRRFNRYWLLGDDLPYS